MKFLTPCFVRVENPAERKELMEWLKAIGYRESIVRRAQIETEEWMTLFTSTQGVFVLLPSNNPSFNPFRNNINCGTNVELFKALAAMNDSNDREQWFIDRVGGDDEYDPKGDHGWYLCKDDKLRCAVDCYSKATAEEIIKHFSDDK